MKKKWLILIIIILALAGYFIFIFPKQSEELSAHPPEDTLRVILTGTGSPVPSLRRFGPSTVIKAGDQTLLFDAGRGTFQRIFQLNIDHEKVDKVFITHLHSDHIIGIVDLMMSGWTFGRYNTFHVWGPEGTKGFIDNIYEAFAFDIHERRSENDFPDLKYEVHEFSKETLLYDKDGLKVNSFYVDHAPIEPAFGFRIEYKGRSVVLSGDTRFSTNLIKHAKGSDVVVHEVAHSSRPLPERYVKTFAHHTSPQDAGKVFNESGTKMGIYTHVILYPGTTKRDLVKETRKTYKGPLTVGEDLMVIDIADDIKIKKLKRPFTKT